MCVSGSLQVVPISRTNLMVRESSLAYLHLRAVHALSSQRQPAVGLLLSITASLGQFATQVQLDCSVTCASKLMVPTLRAARHLMKSCNCLPLPYCIPRF